MEMSSKTQKNPSIRFKGFTDAWERRKALEIFKSVSDKNYPELPVLSASQEKGMVLRDDIGINIKYDEKSVGTYKRVIPGQFVIHLRSFQGGFAYSSIEGITSPAYTVLDFKRKDEYYSLFWRSVFSSRDFIKRLETVTYGIRDGRSISYADFSTLTFNVPTINEQKRIGDFLVSVDSTIALHQRQLDSYKELKTAMLQKVFPQEGEIVPKIRFTGYSGNLEKKKMNQIFSVSILKNKENRFGKKDVLSVSREAGIVNQIEYQGRSFSSDDVSAYKKVEPGDLIYTKSPLKGAPYGIVKASDVVGIVSPLYAVYKGKNLSLGNFVSYYLSNDNIVTRYLTPIVSKGAKNTINITDSGALVGNIMIPKEEKEQQKIVGFFKQLDETIALYQQKVNDYQQLKKAMFQRMFV